MMNSESKFTPGHWGLDAGFESSKPGDFDEYWQVHDGADAIACSANCYAENREANAHLIAAAPDLYEAIKSCLNFMENTESELGISLESADQARAALNKARGES